MLLNVTEKMVSQNMNPEDGMCEDTYLQPMYQGTCR